MPEKRLTKEIAEQSVYLSEFTELDDDAAESLSKHEGYLNLYLSGLTSLSDAAAESLSKHEGRLYLRPYNLPASAAEILRQHRSFQNDDE